jgi:Protein of unknown function/Domain of unknown function (DUF1835)
MVLRGTEAEQTVDEGKVNDPLVVHQLLQSMTDNPEEVIWIWAAQNKHDVCGYYWLMSQLQVFQGRVFILYLNNLPFINEKGNIFYPEWLSQIQPREFIKAKKLARPITPSEFEVDADEWMKTCESGSMVRLLEGGKKLMGAGIDRYDADLSSLITPEFQKASKIIHAFLTRKNKETTGDAFLLWRLKELVHQGGYDVLGELKGARDFELKMKTPTETPA